MQILNPFYAKYVQKYGCEDADFTIFAMNLDLKLKL